MQFKSLLVQAALSSLLSFASADCQLKNEAIDTPEFNTHESNEKLCLSHDEGDWTFAMEVRQVGVPVPDGDNAFAGQVSNYGFAIYDHTCALKGSYDPGKNGNDCGIPFVIMENFLKQVLTVKKVNANLGDSYFQFAYGDGLYSINNNHCDCKPAPDGLTGIEYCGCAFPVSGVSSKKREIEFEA
ncbi:hypothetical protein N0V90_009275 [Kalmusia sp. IMI 367209]|nr:hypothetical protein N0V90_009275 [Kalmusia sp. IMI 367209]